MKNERAIEIINKLNPRIIYLSGKSSTGKTTFANNLRDSHGYSIVELDEIVINSVVKPNNILNPGDAFVSVYQDKEPRRFVDSFIESAKSKIKQTLVSGPVVVEGAIARPRIISEIFSGDLADFLFVYFHPIDISKYEERVERRFMEGALSNTSGLPKLFWSFMSDVDFNLFKEDGKINQGIKSTIKRYVVQSIKDSEERLSLFQQNFPDIVVIEV